MQINKLCALLLLLFASQLASAQSNELIVEDDMLRAYMEHHEVSTYIEYRCAGGSEMRGCTVECSEMGNISLKVSPAKKAYMGTSKSGRQVIVVDAFEKVNRSEGSDTWASVSLRTSCFFQSMIPTFRN